MMRVYLFTDFGKGPRVVKWWPKVTNDEWHGGARVPDSPRTLADADFRCRVGSKAAGVIGSGIPVWLVECESAEAGRVIIADARWAVTAEREGKRIPAKSPGLLALGRILASGGAA